MASYSAPIVCFGTHVRFVLMAWSSDPAASASITEIFTLSFFFGFTHSIILLASEKEGMAWR